jgi:F0F1-type ATP synthase assembly protein I
MLIDFHQNYKSISSKLKGKPNFIGGVMVCLLASSVVDREFIGGVMVSLLASSMVDRDFISGVMVSVLASSMIDRCFLKHCCILYQ